MTINLALVGLIGQYPGTPCTLGSGSLTQNP
jgi:hypothetical protein